MYNDLKAQQDLIAQTIVAMGRRRTLKNVTGAET
jgi:hypothetical protein